MKHMENENVKKSVPMELSDDALDNISGGAQVVKGLVDGEADWLTAKCAKCRRPTTMGRTRYESQLINGTYYCDNCKNAMT